ncbi:uncharacterized protein Z520_09745 [Fonsecaea multimorphosa CBS 102226]|uniref:Cytochrome P450 n=1 Tax=Fonsecaea multimorphosa CBS 102226 TaxID=1442371 RepID=A0A0D2JW21_9EURO|nr:uncharacterized protein Z520_09745 [Fonsecaea multimorphosa CBS 102226]KIX94699.1 hypothetical protein Z520_09745 [Fonsecaea multimorphosa CBS 102226]
MMVTSPQLAAAGTVLGVVSHLAYFIHGEHHRQAFQYFVAFFTFPVIATAAQQLALGIPFVAAVQQTTIFYATYLTGLYSSVFLYRAFFHRLHSFPGPFGAKISKLWHVWNVAPTIKNYKFLTRMHQKYGTFVRTGPCEVSTIHPDAIEVLYGAGSKCTKGAGYESNSDLTSMHQARSRVHHDMRRKAWARGFTQSSLRDYEPRVERYTQSLVEQIRAFSGQPINAAQWFNYYSFDVMGDLAFAKDFDMLKNGQKHWAIEILNGGQRGIGIFGPVPWLFIIMSNIPPVVKEFKKFIKFCEDMMEERMKMKVDRPDISSWILQSPPMTGTHFSEKAWLTGDTRLIIVAGSDTTAATLTHLFYHLAKDQSQLELLREEVESLKGDLDASKLVTLKHLNGAINEALRLHPPVPSGVARLTPPEGITIGGTYIPGGVNILAPSYPLFRSPECYEHPDEFIPERWYSKPELLKRSDAFAPFLIGPYSCIGKQLALMEIRSVTAQILLNFDVSFAPGEDGTTLLEKTLDTFTMELAPLNLCFKPRKQEVEA